MVSQITGKKCLKGARINITTKRKTRQGKRNFSRNVKRKIEIKIGLITGKFFLQKARRSMIT